MDNPNIRICVDCDNEFEITEGFRKLMAQNSDIKEPKRCYLCRQKRKAENRTRRNKDQRR